MVQKMLSLQASQYRSRSRLNERLTISGNKLRRGSLNTALAVD